MYKYFTNEQQNTYEFNAHKSYTLTQSEVERHAFSSGSTDDTLSKYYHFARINFYLSGSDIAQSNPLFDEVFTIGRHMDGTKIFLNKCDGVFFIF